MGSAKRRVHELWSPLTGGATVGRFEASMRRRGWRHSCGRLLFCAPVDSQKPEERRIAGPSHVRVESPRQAEALKEDLDRAHRIALDCEAAGFHRYSDRLCLVQVSTHSATYVVDPLAFDPAELLRPSLEDTRVEVVMHGADFDLRLLKRDLNISVRGLFDTQIAAGLLGVEALGLAALLEERFGVTLSKKYQRADWANRPLTGEMLEYAAADTRYLLSLADQMQTELSAKNRAPWVAQECRALEQAAEVELVEPETVDPVTRVKGARDLTPRQVTALRLAVEWRDRIARERDKALFRVVGDGPLVEAVALNPRRHEELRDIKGFPRGLSRNEGRELVRLLGSVAQIPEAELLPYPKRRGDGRGRPPPEVEELADVLKVVRNARADELGLARGTLLSNAVLLEVARAAPRDLEGLAAVEGMRRWKVEAVGDALLGAMRGR